MMNAQRLTGSAVMQAMTYANQQIDHFIERGRLTFSELAVMVEAIYAMSNVSGGLVFSYAVMSRAKQLIIDERGYLTIQDAYTEVDHIVPSALRELPFYTAHKVRYEELKQFVPLFATSLGAPTVLLKNIVWIKSTQRNLHIPLVMNSVMMDGKSVHDNRHASVSLPIAYLSGARIKCGLIQLPASIFAQVKYQVEQGARNIQLRKSYGKNTHVEVLNVEPAQLLADKRIQPIVGEFWQKFIEYSEAVSEQNAKMPKNVMDAITHTMIYSQKTLPELSTLLF